MKDISPSLARGVWLVAMLILAPGAVWGLAVVVQDPGPYSAPSFLELIRQLGVSPVIAAWIGFVFPVTLALTMVVVIRWARPHDPAANLFGLAVLSLFVLVSGVGTALLTVWPAYLARIVDMAAIEFTIFGLFLFPNGRFVPSWTRWPALGAALTVLAFPGLTAAARAIGTDTAGPGVDRYRWLVTVLTILTLGTWLPAQIYRYRYRSSSVEKLQTRWVLFGFGLVLVGSLGAILLRVFDIQSRWALWALPVGAVGSLVLPLAAGLAIMRYRLYEINRIISRTVSYTALAILLGGVYWGAVFASTRLVPVSGDLAVAGSTLAVAALFNPLRRRIRAVVDRRFNRSHYDAARLIEAFATKVGSGTDLAGMLSEVETLLSRTVAPASAGIWLREAV